LRGFSHVLEVLTSFYCTLLIFHILFIFFVSSSCFLPPTPPSPSMKRGTVFRIRVLIDRIHCASLFRPVGNILHN
jgi:uncharacterized membrane protein